MNLRFENREMAATEAAGKLAYRVYRAVSYGAEPVVNLLLRWRRLVAANTLSAGPSDWAFLLSLGPPAHSSGSTPSL